MYLGMTEDSIDGALAICVILWTWTWSRSTLALFVAGIFCANNIHTALPTHYAATVAHHLDRRTNLHASTEGYRGGWGDMVEMVG
jgi:hypothetical protein